MMPDLGVRLQLLIGPTVPIPAPIEMMQALGELEIKHQDRQRDAFQMTFSLGRSGMGMDYRLLQGGLLDPPNRVTIMVFIQGMPTVLINGMITRHQVRPSNEPGQSQIRVFGEDTSLQLDLEEGSEVYRNMPDSAIVLSILARYPDLMPLITPTTDVPLETQRVTSQQDSDLAFIQALARRNSFIFFSEPSPIPGISMAYWGPKGRTGLLPQRSLTMNMGSATNVEQLSIDFNALEPRTPQATILEPFTGMSIPIPLPGSFLSPLSSRPAPAMRTTILRDTAGADAIQAIRSLLSAANESSDAVTGTGQLDATRYGGVLRSRQQVDVRGAGRTNDGRYYVQQVTHRIKQGEYKQSFTLKREGRGATSEVVIP
jgi:hypothetical protein